MSPRTRNAAAAVAPAPAPIFAALGDVTRLRLVAKLCESSPQSITTLTHDFALTRQAVSKHLRVLEGAGVVESVRSGRESLYTLRRQPIDAARLYLEDVARQWEDALGRLKTFVEQDR